MDGHEDTGEVQNGGEDCVHSNLDVGDAHVLSHQEGSSAHDGRHDLTAGGSGSLNGSGELGLVAGVLHHGDGDGAGGNGVADGGAGHHAAKSRGDNGNLGGTAGSPTHRAVSQSDEEVGDTGSLKEGAENNEHTDELGADLNGGGQHAGGAVEHGVDNARQGLTGSEGIDHQHADDAQDGDTDTAAAELSHDQNANDTDGNVEGGELGCAGDVVAHHIHVVERIPEERECAGNHDNDIIDGHTVGSHVTLLDGIGEEAHDNDAAQEHGQTDLKVRGGEQSGIDAVQREDDVDSAHKQLGLAGPDTDVGLCVILTHQRIDLCRSLVIQALFQIDDLALDGLVGVGH